MSIDKSLFDGKLIRLAAIDRENDAEVEARWTQDAEYLRMLGAQPAYPLSPAHLKKRYEKIEKDEEESKDLFYFTIHTLAGDRLVGFAKIYWIDWVNGNGYIQLGIGEVLDRHQGYGCEALNMLIRYAFSELNLFRISAVIPEYNQAALGLAEDAGFTIEVRRRQALNRDGSRWDQIHLGLLQSEWQAQFKEEE